MSAAGKGAGLDGKRSGLYVEVIRMIREARPELVLVENVPRLLGLHFERLLRDLSDSGYDCEWDVISAAAAGAPHLRERLWILAYPAGEGIAPRAFGRTIKRSKLDPQTTGKVKWPRAGMMCQGVVFESEPVAPRKTKRLDGRTYWVGVDLFGDHARDQQGTARVPSPVARDWKGSGMRSQLGTCAADGSLASRLLPTPTNGDARQSRYATVSRTEGQNHHSGTTLSDLAFDGSLQRLLPTSAATSYGSNHGGAAGRVGEVRHSLESMARQGLLPTPRSTDGDRGGRGDLIQVVRGNSNGHFGAKMWDSTQSGLSEPLSRSEATVRRFLPPARFGDVPGPPDPSALEGVGQSSSLWPTPHSSWNENRGTLREPSVSLGKHGAKLSEEVAESEVEAGRERGSLHPDWVEWLMRLPVGWTDIDCDEPVYRPFWDEPLPRVIKTCANRRQRLSAIGNSLVWLIPYLILSRYQERVGHLPGSRVNLSAFAE